MDQHLSQTDEKVVAKNVSSNEDATTMKQKQALQVLINGLELACKRGAFNMEEVASLYEAVRIFKS